MEEEILSFWQSNNTFEKCNFSDWGSVIEIGTNIAGSSARTAVFTNIEISANTFTDIPSKLMRINNINGLILSGNTVEIGEYFDKNNMQGKIQMYKYCSNITYTDNVFTDGGFLDSKKIVLSENIAVWAEVNSQL